MRITMVGAGAWGSAVAKALDRNGHEVAFVHRHDEAMPKGFAAELVFVAVPCQVLRARLSQLEKPEVPVVSLVKGVEIDTGKRVTEIIKDVWGGVPVGSLSGPTLAAEVQAEAPCAAVVASEDDGACQVMQEVLHQKLFRVYRSNDLVGVEFGGAFKNMYAIAGGICSGLRVGENGTAALMTRSLAEMVRLGVSLGAQKETLFGLSGVGDLMLTAYSGLSRNHMLGAGLGQGGQLKEVLESLPGVAEGVGTVKAAHEIVEMKGIQAPILKELYRVLYEGKVVKAAVNDLLMRQAEEEMIG